MDFGHAACRRVRGLRLNLMRFFPGRQSVCRIMSAKNGSDGSALADASCDNRCHRERVALRMRLPSDSKSPRPVYRRGLQNSCDGELMPVICPTCQIL